MNLDSAARLELLDSLCRAIWEPAEENFKQERNALIARNSHSLESDQQVVRFRGKVLGEENYRILPRPVNSVVPRLQSAFVDYTQRYDAFLSEKRIHKGYFQLALSASQSPRDYARLVPDKLIPVIESIASRAMHWPSELSEAEIDAFLLKHEKAFNKVKQRIITNILI